LISLSLDRLAAKCRHAPFGEWILRRGCAAKRSGLGETLLPGINIRRRHVFGAGGKRPFLL
jgi:hypothetical protein